MLIFYILIILPANVSFITFIHVWMYTEYSSKLWLCNLNSISGMDVIIHLLPSLSRSPTLASSLLSVNHTDLMRCLCEQTWVHVHPTVWIPFRHLQHLHFNMFIMCVCTHVLTYVWNRGKVSQCNMALYMVRIVRFS